MTKSETLKKLRGLTRSDLKHARSRTRLIEFMKHCWMRPDKPLLIGIHTTAITNAIDIAMKRFNAGKSTFLKISVCFRQGKSEIVSRYLPAKFLGDHPNSEVLLTSHTSAQAKKFSRDSRSILDSKQFRLLYPHVRLNPTNHSLGDWGIHNHTGNYHCIGLGAASAGVGGALIVIDDYFSGRQQAEKEPERNKVWDGFKDNIMSRRASPCIVVICCTPWHVDGLISRIDKQMKVDPLFPQFTTMKFPAFSPKYKTGTLFPEMYPAEWYEGHRATLSKYSFSGLMQCNPRPHGSNLFKIENLKYFKKLPTHCKVLPQYRAWDLASSKKERINKNDPDYTVGVRGCVYYEESTVIKGAKIPHLYITGIERGQWEAPERNLKIINTAVLDGANTKVSIEGFGAYKDAFILLKQILTGVASVKKLNLPGDKLTKASPLELVCESSNIYISTDIPQKHIKALIDEFETFPLGKHDDVVDACAMMYHSSSGSGIRLYTSKMLDKTET